MYVQPQEFPEQNGGYIYMNIVMTLKQPCVCRKNEQIPRNGFIIILPQGTVMFEKLFA